jgi:hypothetical protein
MEYSTRPKYVSNRGARLALCMPRAAIDAVEGAQPLDVNGEFLAFCENPGMRKIWGRAKRGHGRDGRSGAGKRIVPVGALAQSLSDCLEHGDQRRPQFPDLLFACDASQTAIELQAEYAVSDIVVGQMGGQG